MTYIYILITPYIRMLDSDWLIAVIFFLQIQAMHCEFSEFLIHFVTSVSVKGKNGKYDCYIKRTTDNVLQILLQASR
jgi:hypothetical protein